MAQMSTPQSTEGKIFTVRHPYCNFQIKTACYADDGWGRRNIVNRSPLETLCYEEYSRTIPAGTSLEKIS
eukprot:2710905-Rhodomonas_salina.1